MFRYGSTAPRAAARGKRFIRNAFFDILYAKDETDEYVTAAELSY